MQILPSRPPRHRCGDAPCILNRASKPTRKHAIPCMDRNVLRRRGMSSCIELAGFAAAQAVCCLFDRMPLPPLAFNRRASGPLSVTILPGGKPDDVAAHGRRWLETNSDKADEAVVVYDAYVTI